MSWMSRRLMFPQGSCARAESIRPTSPLDCRVTQRAWNMNTLEQGCQGPPPWKRLPLLQALRRTLLTACTSTPWLIRSTIQAKVHPPCHALQLAPQRLCFTVTPCTHTRICRHGSSFSSTPRYISQASVHPAKISQCCKCMPISIPLL